MTRVVSLILGITIALAACGRSNELTYSTRRDSLGSGDGNPNPSPTATVSPFPTPTVCPTLTPTPAPTPQLTFDDAVKNITESRIKTDLMYLAGPTLEGRKPGTEGGRLAREFVAAELAKAGIQPAVSGQWFQPFTARRLDSGERVQAYNVLGVLPGNDSALSKEVIVIGGHFDHLGKNSSGAIYAGADDNASGTEAMIEIARAAALLKRSFRRTILFAAFDAEEKGLVGSEYYVANPVFPIANTVYMINMDMIGYVGKAGRIQALGGGSSPSAAALIRSIAPKYPRVGTPSITSSAGGGSDHVPFASSTVPHVFFHTGTSVSPYHQPGDTPDKLDYPGLTDVTKLVFELLWKTSQADAAPTHGDMSESFSTSFEPFADHDVRPLVK